MRTEYRRLAEQIKGRLTAYSDSAAALPGIESGVALDTLVFQIIESIRRIRFVREIASRPISHSRLDPGSELFDPIRASILSLHAGKIDEAGWLIFLFTHFGKNLKSEYRLLRDIYGRLGKGGTWDWQTTSNDSFGFRRWLGQHSSHLKSDQSSHRGFGNHRKYQSLDAWKDNGTGSAVESYVAWVKNSGGHEALFKRAMESAHGDGKAAFRNVYREMDAVKSFGRTAKFDYLSMIGKTGLAQIEPDSVYFHGATGPVRGAKLLFHGEPNFPGSVKVLEQRTNELSDAIQIGKQAMEDSLCNWQKSPNIPVSFRG